MMESTNKTHVVARFSLVDSEPPPVANTLPLAEAARAALMGIYQRQQHVQKYGAAARPYRERFYSETFAGKDGAGRPLCGHGHAFVLPTDEDGDGRIDHLTVTAERGFSAEEVRTLDRFRELRWGQGNPLRLLLVGLGRECDFRSRLFESATTWVSATPFVATRFPKLRGRKRDQPSMHSSPTEFARHVLLEELDRLRGRRPELPRVREVSALDRFGSGGRCRPIEFARTRRKSGDDGGRRPCGAFRIVFESPAQGPLCLGHASHFGLGLFLPE